MVTFSKYDIATKIGKNIEELVRNLHKFKINMKNRHKRAPVPVYGYDLEWAITVIYNYTFNSFLKYRITYHLKFRTRCK